MVLISWYAWSCRQLQAVSHLSLENYFDIKVHGLSSKSSAEAGIGPLKYKFSSYMVWMNSCYSFLNCRTAKIAASHFYSNLRSHEGDLLSKTRRILSHYKLNTWYFKSLRSWILWKKGKSTNIYEGNSKGALQKTTVNGRFKIRSTIA